MMSERLYLVKNGTPWQVAWEAEADEVIAFMVTFASFDGLEWDWRTRSFKERK